MKFKLEMNVQKCVSRFDPRFARAQKFLDSEVIKDCSPYTPFRTGNLMNSATRGTVIGSGEVIYNAPYARAMYYGRGLHFSTDKHPQAGAQWFERTKAVKKKDWDKGVNKIVRGE